MRAYTEQRLSSSGYLDSSEIILVRGLIEAKEPMKM